jgi:hypothetical protein
MKISKSKIDELCKNFEIATSGDAINILNQQEQYRNKLLNNCDNSPVKGYNKFYFKDGIYIEPRK